MEFQIYLRRLSDRLGEAQLPVNSHWRRADQIVCADAVHYPLVKRVVADLYKRNRCSNPSDPVTIDTVLDYLGQLQYELSSRSGHDLDAVALIERIGEISVAIFRMEDADDEPAFESHGRYGQPQPGRRRSG